MKKINRALTTAMLFSFCAVLTVFSKPASEAASSSLAMCLKSLIPSLFPYMVASSMLVSCGACEAFGKLLPAAKIFGINGRSSGAIILGALCGFPLGAKIAVDFYKKGLLSKTETEALISVANNTGPSFVVAFIGAGLWGNTAFGWKLYLAQIGSALAAGVIVNRIIAPLPKCENKLEIHSSQESFPVIFTRAVTESVSAVLSVCGFVMFFAVVCAYLKLLTDAMSPVITGALFSALELTSASEYAAQIASQGLLAQGGFIAGFALGFSGLSVFCQAASFTVPAGLSLGRTFAVKSFQGVLCGACASVIILYEKTETAAIAFNTNTAAVSSLIVTTIFALFILKNALKA